VRDVTFEHSTKMRLGIEAALDAELRIAEGSRLEAGTHVGGAARAPSKVFRSEPRTTTLSPAVGSPPVAVVVPTPSLPPTPLEPAARGPLDVPVHSPLAPQFGPRTEVPSKHVPIDVLALDHLLDQLARTSHMLVVPLAAAAYELVKCRAFVPYGYQSFHDFTRETLDRSSRWVRDLAALHVALGRFPELGRALAGVDGGASIGRQKAIAIARVATAPSRGATDSSSGLAVSSSDAAGSSIGPASIGLWIERARALPYPALLEELRTARTQISSKARSADAGLRARPSPRRRVSLSSTRA
jgi:hypothetical protein